MHGECAFCLSSLRKKVSGLQSTAEQQQDASKEEKERKEKKKKEKKTQKKKDFLSRRHGCFLLALLWESPRDGNGYVRDSKGPLHRKLLLFKVAQKQRMRKVNT